MCWCYSDSADPDRVDPVGSACSVSALFAANDKTRPSRTIGSGVG